MICEYFHYKKDLDARIKRLEKQGNKILTILEDKEDQGYNLAYRKQNVRDKASARRKARS